MRTNPPEVIFLCLLNGPIICTPTPALMLSLLTMVRLVRSNSPEVLFLGLLVGSLPCTSAPGIRFFLITVVILGQFDPPGSKFFLVTGWLLNFMSFSSALIYSSIFDLSFPLFSILVTWVWFGPCGPLVLVFLAWLDPPGSPGLPLLVFLARMDPPGYSWIHLQFSSMPCSLPPAFGSPSFPTSSSLIDFPALSYSFLFGLAVHLAGI